MEPATILVFAGAIIQTIGAAAGFSGISRSGARPPFGQLGWMRRNFRGETSREEQSQFRKMLLFGGVGWTLIITGFVIS